MNALGLSADQVLTTTRAVRKRLDMSRPVDRHMIEACVNVAKQAPTPNNRQAWDFVVMTDPTVIAEVAGWWRQGLLAVTQDGRGVLARSAPADAGTRPTRMGGDSEQARRIAESLDVLASTLHKAPVLMLACARVRSRADVDTVIGQANVWGGVIPAVWSFMLAAREQALGTCWTTAHLPYEREVADVLRIPFETTVQTVMTPVAYTVGTDFKAARRAATDDFVHWNGW